MIEIKKEDIAESLSAPSEVLRIQGLVYVVRGKQIMLDSDLAMLYQVETKRLNEAVKRNRARFPEIFRFQLKQNEYENLKSQFATSSFRESNDYGGRRKLPYVFTEQGIAMLSAVLRSDVAIQVSIRIMETFVEMRKYRADTELLHNRMDTIEKKQSIFQSQTDERLEKVFEYISEHEESQQKIFFAGQIFDAFHLLTSIMGEAMDNITLIDNYVDVGTLNILSKKRDGVKVMIYTARKSRLSEKDVGIFNKQYPTLELGYTDAFHDRFLIIDEVKAYHIGASLKDAGKKCFAISLLNDGRMIQDIIQRLEFGVEGCV